MVSLALLVTSACGSSETPDAGATSTTAAATGGGGSTSTSTATPQGDAPAGGEGGDGTSTTGVTVAAHGPLPTLDLDEDEQAFVDALMGQQPPESMDAEQAECIAGHWIQAVGVDAVEGAGVTAEGIAAGTSSINDIPVDRATAEKVVDSYESCEFDLVDLVVTGFSSMVQGDPTKLSCLEDAVTPEVAREYMISALMATESGAPDLAEIQTLIEPCLA
jgi:hypothetical protein